MSVGLKTLAVVTVATAGVRVQLSTTRTMAQAVRIEADDGNAGNLFVGDANVAAARYTTKLAAGDSLTIEGSAVDMRTVWLDADADAQVAQVSWL